MNPTTALLLAMLRWFTSAMKPAHNGAAQLVPTTTSGEPLSSKIKISSAIIATSGELRNTGEPWLFAMLTPCCQLGMGYCGLMPPPLPSVVSPELNPFQTTSETHAPVCPPDVVSVVPPTLVR